MSVVATPERFNEVYGLGEALAVFRIRKLRTWGNVVTALVLLLLAAAAFLFGVWRAVDVVRRNGPILFWNSFLPWVITAVILFLLGLLAAWGAFTNWKRAVVVYTNGLAYSDRKGLQYMRWEEIDALQMAVTKHYTNGIYTGTTHKYTVHRREGTRINLDDGIQQVENCANLVREKLFPVVYGKLSAAYNAGQSLSFGPVTISRQNGLTVGKKTYPWDQIAAVSVNQGVLQVAKKGGGLFSGASAPAASILNLEVLLSIVDQVVGVKLGK